MTTTPAAAALDDITLLTEAGWDDFVRGHVHASLFLSSPWLRAIEGAYGFEFRATVLRSASGAIEAALPYCRIEDASGARVRCLPFCDYADPLCSSDQFGVLLSPLTQADQRVILRVLHHEGPKTHPTLAPTGMALWHRIAIADSTEATFNAFAPTARRAAARARKLGTKIRWTDDADDVSRFHAMHTHVRKRKYQMLPQPREFFELIRQEFCAIGAAHLAVAEWNGDVVGGTFFLGWGDTLYYKFNASITHECYPNDLILADAVEFAVQHGYRFIDLGLSDADQDGLLRFKRKYATDEAQITTYACGRADSSPAALEFRHVLNQAVELLVDPSVPDDVTVRAGDRLYRYFA